MWADLLWWLAGQPRTSKCGPFFTWLASLKRSLAAVRRVSTNISQTGVKIVYTYDLSIARYEEFFLQQQSCFLIFFWHTRATRPRLMMACKPECTLYRVMMCICKQRISCSVWYKKKLCVGITILAGTGVLMLLFEKKKATFVNQFNNKTPFRHASKYYIFHGVLKRTPHANTCIQWSLSSV